MITQYIISFAVLVISPVRSLKLFILKYIHVKNITTVYQSDETQMDGRKYRMQFVISESVWFLLFYFHSEY